MTFRVVHRLSGDRAQCDQFTKYAASLRVEGGVVESEVYSAIDDDTDLALVQLWDDEASFSSYWEGCLERPSEDPFATAVLAGAVESEFYTQQRFYLDRVWVSEGFRDRTPRVTWPAGGAVRIIIVSANDDIEGSRPRLERDMWSTRREPGCEHYAWYQGTEFSNSLVLLEKWSDQVAYDAHWHLRQKTAKPANSSAAPAVREYGERSLEFYRWRGLSHHYDRWLPSDVAERSETIVWPE